MKRTSFRMSSSFGAIAGIRTPDLILTKDALYLLSYNSVFTFKRKVNEMATQNGLEPSTSSVTGWRSNQLNYRANLI